MHAAIVRRLSFRCLWAAGFAALALALPLRAEETGWVELTSEKWQEVWKGPTDDWQRVGNVSLDPKDPKKLVHQAGNDALVNGRTGKLRDLVTKQSFGDVEVHVEFLIPKGSNSGVKLCGLYEIQILDTYGKKELTGDSLGGIYPRAELTPRYHYLDKGVPPRTNAAKPAGEWQTLDIWFVAPRFDASGKKTGNALFWRVVLNGQDIHNVVDVATPTGHNWTKKDVSTGPLLLQGDHGPVAFRNVRVRPFIKIATGVALPHVVTGFEEPLATLQWPQWRGPWKNGNAPDTSPPVEWDEKKNVKWKAALPGRGSATPIVWGEQVFLVTAIDTGRKADPNDIPKPDPGFQKRTSPPPTYHQFVVRAFDRSSGKERWRQVAAEQVPHEGHHDSHSYAAASPTTDGKHLYVSFGSRGIYCYDLDGNLKWKRDLGRLNTRLGWGEGASPTLHKDALVVPWDQEANSKVYVLDARTGETRWQADRDEPTSWATPLVVEHNGRTQVIMTATNKVRSYDLASGEVIWQCGGLTVNCIPSPVLYRDMVIVMSGYQGAAAMAIPLDSKGDLTGSDKVAWRHDRGTPYVPSPVLVGDRLYFTQSNNPSLSCLDAKTGKVIIDRERLPGLKSLYASPVAAAGRLYFVGREGTTLVLKQADKVEVLATNRLDDPIDASPVVVGKQLFLRGAKYLYCLEGN